jgi:tetratricopeptide (TPR) repeat protein
LLSNIYSVAKKNAESEAELLACLKIDADSIAVNNDLGYQWADQGKNLPEAEAMIRKAIELDRKSRKGLFAVRPDADKDFKDNACYIDSLGWVLFRRGQVEAARKELEYAATLPDGDDPVIFEHLGEVYLSLGQRDLAITAFRQAIHFYGEGKRRKMDDKLKALQERVQQLESK